MCSAPQLSTQALLSSDLLSLPDAFKLEDVTRAGLCWNKSPTLVALDSLQDVALPPFLFSCIFLLISFVERRSRMARHTHHKLSTLVS